MNIPKKEELGTGGKMGTLYFKKNYNEFYNHLINKYRNYNYTKFSELLYCHYNDITEHPKCPICGKETKFISFYSGYQQFCSIKCAGQSPEIISKRENTNLNKYGVKHACQNESIMDKAKQIYIKNNGGMGNASKKVKDLHFKTMESRYGTKHALCNEELKSKMISTNIELYGGIGNGSQIIKEKIIGTNLNKYGDKYSLSNKDIRNKINKTNIEKYGYKNPASNSIIGNKISNTKRNAIITNNDNIIDIFDNNDQIFYICKCPHKNCNKCIDKQFIIENRLYYDRLKDNTEICTNLLPPQKYRGEGTTIELFIRNILDENGFQYETNNRTILGGKEIDIYIPSKQIAIECNGIYWHSYDNKPIKYHINKYAECLNKGIQLITIWEDWIIHKPEIVRSIILNKLGMTSSTIYARKCIIKEVSTKDSNEFLNKNHIQGKTYASIKLGLYYNDELVSLMTFGKKKGCMGNTNKTLNEFELSRFCSKLNTYVIGGASKLLKYFINNYNPKSIYSFSSNDISNGNLYKQLGFQSTNKINTAYWYINMNDMQRYHRTTFTKDRIIAMGLASPDKQWKEKDIMRENRYLQIYDSGQMKWIYNIE